ncbi:MAG TPA: hypothetical protein VJT85_10355 [Gemmatimonadaceae bacterium]|nr:hypothetical protein [Gemmatimonadaceae bacterium]
MGDALVSGRSASDALGMREAVIPSERSESSDPHIRTPARAIVWVGGHATSYLRAGCGAVVVLLVADHDGPKALELIALLSTLHLVIAPSVPSGVALADWLANLMDGLGIATASVVAEPAFIDDVRGLARDDGERVLRVTELNGGAEVRW